MARFGSAMLVLAVLTGPGYACAADQSRLPQTARSDSLELPGLTAGCHVCEWRPKLNQMPAADQCGIDDAGTGRSGLFECGFAPDCQRECRFLRCGTD